MGMVTGLNTCVQIGKETTWGTKVTATVAINYTSEGFKLVEDKTEEDSLIGSATTREMDIQKESVEWDLAILAKPENVGMLLAMAMGTESAATAVSGATGAYKHEFTPIKNGASASLPKFSAVVDRHVAVKAYTGCKVDSMQISGKAGDYIRITLSGKGKTEEAGSVVSSLLVPSIKAFKFAGATITFDGTEFGDVTSVDFSYNNALDEGEQTSGSGIYGTEPEPQKRDISANLEVFFNAASNTIRDGKFKQNATAAVVLKFESPDEAASGTKYSMEISMPLFVITDCNPNVNGSEKIKMTISGKATESASLDAVKITLVDKKNSKYA